MAQVWGRNRVRKKEKAFQGIKKRSEDYFFKSFSENSLEAAKEGTEQLWLLIKVLLCNKVGGTVLIVQNMVLQVGDMGISALSNVLIV